jgi:hypothetical protein
MEQNCFLNAASGKNSRPSRSLCTMISRHGSRDMKVCRTAKEILQTQRDNLIDFLRTSRSPQPYRCLCRGVEPVLMGVTPLRRQRSLEIKRETQPLSRIWLGFRKGSNKGRGRLSTVLHAILQTPSGTVFLNILSGNLFVLTGPNEAHVAFWGMTGWSIQEK